MMLYTETTDGSNIETKETALVWHHQEADPDFGSCQAKELLDHLENVVANEPAVVMRGQHIVEVKPQVNTTNYVSCCICFYSMCSMLMRIHVKDPLNHTYGEIMHAFIHL